MRASTFPRLLVPIVAIACFAAPAGAEGEAADGHSVDLIQANTDVAVAIATVVAFVVLLLVLTKFAWRPILVGLKTREEGIRASIEGAEKANADAKALLAEYERRMADAAGEARAILEEGRRDSEALRAKIEAEARAEAARERERAVRDIEIAKAGALKEIYESTAELATAVAERIVEQRLDPAQHRRLVDETVASFERTRKAPGGRG